MVFFSFPICFLKSNFGKQLKVYILKSKIQKTSSEIGKLYLRRKQGKNKKIGEWEEHIYVHHKKKGKRKALSESDRTANI